jgi:hypothetical protein
VHQFSSAVGRPDVGAGDADSYCRFRQYFLRRGQLHATFVRDPGICMHFGTFAGAVSSQEGFERMCDGNSWGMTNDTQQAPLENAEKDTSEWVTGDEPMTGPQRSYLNTLAHEAGRDIPDDLTKAQASELIDELQQQTGRSR